MQEPHSEGVAIHADLESCAGGREGIGGRTSAWGANGAFRQQYTGQYRDDESKLDYFNSRYLAAAMGRFLSPDPAFVDQHVGDPQSWNTYSYMRNNPLRFSDPTASTSATSS